MSQLGHGLVASFVAFVALGTAAVLATVVEYVPYGVPATSRAAYEQRIASLAPLQRTTANVVDHDAPQVVVSSRHHDFGWMDPHATATHAFEVTNGGTQPLALSLEGTSCKCTVGEIAGEIVPPGESTRVTMTWNTGYQVEDYQQTAVIATNDPALPRLELSVSGSVRAECVVPEQIVFQAVDPGEVAEASFMVYSQAYEAFIVREVLCPLSGFQWFAEPVAVDDAALRDTEAASAWRLTIQSTADNVGDFSGTLELEIEPLAEGAIIKKSVALHGKVRSPVSFYSPELHLQAGLDIGTLVADRDHRFPIVVRERSGSARKLAVLDVQPETLVATLSPMRRAGEYRMVITVPAGSPTTCFNRDAQHGFVQVGDPHDPSFSNWFPVVGAIVHSVE